MGPWPRLGWRVKEVLVASYVQVAANIREFSGPLELVGIKPFEFSGQRVHAALTDQMAVRVGPRGPMPGNALRDSCHINGRKLSLLNYVLSINFYCLFLSFK